MAQFFGLDRILVGKAIYDTAKEGQTASKSYVWGKHFLLAYVAPSPGRKRPSLGYTFWAPTKGMLRIAEIYRDETITSDVMRVHEERLEKIVHVNCGYLMVNAVA